MMLRKTPVMDNPYSRATLADEGDIFGALVHYRELKTRMLLTLEWGYVVPIRRPAMRPKHLIMSMVGRFLVTIVRIRG